MRNEQVDWDALLEKRLIESRGRQRDEAQAAAPPPGPQAAEQVIEKLRTAAENGQLGQTAPAPAEERRFELPTMPETPRPAPPARRPSTRQVPPIIYMVPPRGSGGRRRSGLNRIKQVVFWLVLLAMLVTGVVLTFWPEALRRLGLGGEEPPSRNAPPAGRPADEPSDLPAAPPGGVRPPAEPVPVRRPADDPPPPAPEPVRPKLPREKLPPAEPEPPAGREPSEPAPGKTRPDGEPSPAPVPVPAPAPDSKPALPGPIPPPDPSELAPPAPPEPLEPLDPPADDELHGA